MLYGLVLRLRHLFYDKGWAKSTRPSVPTICVGNVSVGGTGKTPHTEYLLRLLLHSDDWGFRPLAVLSRGYKRKSKGYQLIPPEGSALQYGDEPVQMARKFPSVAVAVCKNRIEGCRRLAEEGSQLIILDDALQYRKLQAAMNIVLVDYNHPVQKDRLLPYGHLRDLPSRLKKAHVVIVTKCPSFLDEAEPRRWRKELRLTDNQPLFFTTLRYAEPQPVFLDGDTHYLYAKQVILVSGIANDAPLRNYLSDKYKIARRIAFPDHHAFTRRDIRSILRAVKETPTACLVTTEKDAGRLQDVKDVPPELRRRMFYIPIEAAFLSAEEEAAFTQTLFSRISF